MTNYWEEAAKAWLRPTVEETFSVMMPFSEVKNVEIRSDCDGTQSAIMELDISDGGRTISNAIKDIYPFSFLIPRIKKVIFNPPATIVLWKDGTKTVVKCMEGDSFSEWTGLSLCICKKLLGKDFHRFFRKYCNDEMPENATVLDDIRKFQYKTEDV